MGLDQQQSAVYLVIKNTSLPFLLINTGVFAWPRQKIASIDLKPWWYDIVKVIKINFVVHVAADKCYHTPNKNNYISEGSSFHINKHWIGWTQWLTDNCYDIRVHMESIRLNMLTLAWLLLSSLWIT